MKFFFEDKNSNVKKDSVRIVSKFAWFPIKIQYKTGWEIIWLGKYYVTERALLRRNMKYENLYQIEWEIQKDLICSTKEIAEKVVASGIKNQLFSEHVK